MIPRGWMIPTLPIAAIASAWLIVFGIGWWMEHGSDLRDPVPRETTKAIDAIFDKVISREDWLAAGMPSGESSFREGRTRSFSDYYSFRRLGKSGTPQGWLTLFVRRPDEMQGRVHEGLLHDDVAYCVKLAEGFETGTNNLASA